MTSEGQDARKGQSLCKQTNWRSQVAEVTDTRLTSPLRYHGKLLNVPFPNDKTVYVGQEKKKKGNKKLEKKK